MTVRGLVLAGGALALLAVTAGLAWPSLADAVARRVEGRLRAETGQAWRVEGVGLALAPGPQVVLRNAAFGDDRPGADTAGGRMRVLRIADPVAMLLGSGGNGHLIAEGLSLRLPLVRDRGSAPVQTPALPAGGAIRIEAEGVAAALAESGRAATASAERLDLVFDRAGPADRTAIRASLDGAGVGAVLSLDLPSAAGATGPLTLRLDPRGGDGRRLTLDANAGLRPGAFRLEAATGTIDGTPFAGGLEVAWDGALPRIALDARLDALTLTDRETAAAPTEADAGRPGLLVRVDPAMIPQARWFTGFEGGGSLKVGRLALGPARLEGVDLAPTVKDGLAATVTAASVYGGSARGRYTLAPEADGIGRHQLVLALKGARVRPLLKDIAGVEAIDGSGALNLDLRARGDRIEAVRTSLAGTADLVVSDGRIEGLDLAGLLGLGDAGRTRRTGLGTRLDRLSGACTITEGQASVRQLVLKTPLIEAEGGGSLDLVGRTLDIRLDPRLAGPGRRPLDIPVRIAGPWDAPAVSADLAGAARQAPGLIDTLQDLGGGLLKGDAGDLGDAIGQSIGGFFDDLLGRPQRRPQDRRGPPAQGGGPR